MRRGNRFIFMNIVIHIVSSNRQEIQTIIDKASFPLEYEIYFINGLHHAHCYGEKSERDALLIMSSLVSNDTYVYEYHSNGGICYHNYLYHKIPVLDLSTLVDVAFRIGNVSIVEAMETILRKKIFSLSLDEFYILLHIRDTVFYKSLIQELLSIYLDSKNRLYTHGNPIEKLYSDIEFLIFKFKDNAYLLNNLSNLTYKQFCFITNK